MTGQQYFAGTHSNTQLHLVAWSQNPFFPTSPAEISPSTGLFVADVCYD